MNLEIHKLMFVPYVRLLMKKRHLTNNILLVLAIIFYTSAVNAERIPSSENTGNDYYDFRTFDSVGSIYVYRNWSFKAGGVDTELYLNDEKVGLADNGTAFIIKAAPGAHDIWVTGINNYSSLLHKEVIVERNRAYFISISIWDGAITEVDEIKGKDEIMDIIFKPKKKKRLNE